MDHLPNYSRHARLSKMIYSGVLVIFVLTILVFFIYSTRFISSEFDRIFDVELVTNSFSIDLKNYKLVAHKLGLPENIATVPVTTE